MNIDRQKPKLDPEGKNRETHRIRYGAIFMCLTEKILEICSLAATLDGSTPRYCKSDQKPHLGVPIIGVLSTILLLGARPSALFFTGLGLVLGGMGLAARATKRLAAEG